MKLSPSAKTVLEKLNNNGFEGYLVGGCVRDHIMNRACGDYDVTTNALPEQMLEIFKGMKLIITGIKHGTVTVLAPEPIEVTTYRVDGEYTDSRHPDRVSFTSCINDDLARRDLTINAIAYGNGKYIDLFGGMDDIKARTVRTVGDPVERFGEDALRILRAVRFSSQLGFDIEEKTAQAAEKMAHTLSGVSPERKLVELNKFILGQNVAGALMNNPGVICACLPELKSVFELEDISLTVKAVANLPKDADLRFAALLCGLEENAEKSASIALDAMKRLRADNKTAKSIYLLIKHRDCEPLNDRDIKYLLRDLGKDITCKLFTLWEAFAKADDQEDRQRHLTDMARRCREIISSGECYCIKDLAIDGNHLTQMGFCSREVGKALKRALNGVINGEVKNSKEDIIKYLNQKENNDE